MKIRLKKRVKRKLIIIGIMFVLLCILFGIYKYVTRPYVIFNHSEEIVELQGTFDPKSFVKKVRKYTIDDLVIDASNVNVKELGTYYIQYNLKTKSYRLEVKVKDTTPPLLEVKDKKIELGEEVKPEDFVTKVEDLTHSTIEFKKKYKFNKEGEQEIIIVAKDSSSNKTEKTVKVTVYKDKEPPVLTGLQDIYASVGEEINYKARVSIKDDHDPSPTFEVDASKVDKDTEGEYVVTYTVKDRSGNTKDYTQKVIIKKREQSSSIAPSGNKIVYLTFDDGPSNQTEKILKVLDKYNCKATFFVTGQNSKYRYLIKEAHNKGHTIALHTYSHTYSKVYASVNAYFDDLNKVGKIVEEQIGFVPKYIRFPGGSSNVVSKKYCPGIMTTLTQEVQKRGYQYYDWNADTTDAMGNNRPVSVLVKNGTSSTAKNINILAHDTAAKATTVEALPQIIEHYQALGYVFKGIDDNSFTPHQHVNN